MRLLAAEHGYASCEDTSSASGKTSVFINAFTDLPPPTVGPTIPGHAFLLSVLGVGWMNLHSAFLASNTNPLGYLEPKGSLSRHEQTDSLMSW